MLFGFAIINSDRIYSSKMDIDMKKIVFIIIPTLLCHSLKSARLTVENKTNQKITVTALVKKGTNAEFDAVQCATANNWICNAYSSTIHVPAHATKRLSFTDNPCYKKWPCCCSLDSLQVQYDEPFAVKNNNKFPENGHVYRVKHKSETEVTVTEK